MNNKELLLKEIELVPDQLLGELLDFVHFLKAKTVKEQVNTYIASETSLRKDWLKPEEDKPWQNL
ncbi:MAG: DUF2281 domain-containing protein [Proteobacteria bacterium]|jgi:hypothetical protein|nr:DUF2281 domain-containing protein [Pseudomonadota bacterium]